MPSARSTVRRKVHAIYFSFILLFTAPVLAQDNSPYSRYGLGDQFPQNNVSTRALGGITAGYTDFYSVNFSNPASYSSFFTVRERATTKLTAGRVILDVGMNMDNRRLIQPNTTNTFTATDAFFSYLQVGVPLRTNLGISFGLRPLNRVNYRINRFELLTDPLTGMPIDSAVTQFRGSGGSFLPYFGTGFAIGKFSAGANMGYLFGHKETSTRRAFLNDTMFYYASDHTNNGSYRGLFFNAGMQYRFDLGKQKYIRLGLSGNWQQEISGTMDSIRQTFTTSGTGEFIQIDSVFRHSGIPGSVIIPSSYRLGFVAGDEVNGWLFGVDYSVASWQDFRYFGRQDSTTSSWQINAGGQFRPRATENYFSNIIYRFGLMAGRDYIQVRNNLPLFGVSAGLGLPIMNRNRQAANQRSFVNLSLEYNRRGDNDNALRENLFRFSVGLDFTDLWFRKRRYD